MIKINIMNIRIKKILIKFLIGLTLYINFLDFRIYKFIDKTITNFNNFLEKKFETNISKIYFYIKNKLRLPSKYINMFIKYKTKLFILLIIITYFIKYYFNVFFDYLLAGYTTSVTNPEARSLIYACIIALLIYYFFVIELSIYLFDYSLICYRYLYLFVFITSLVWWGTETNFLKFYLEEDSLTIENMFFSVGGYVHPTVKWVAYYNGKTPFTYTNFLCNYKLGRFFYDSFISEYENDLWELGEELMFLCVFILLMFWYTCSYGFNPIYINFVSKYFIPYLEFFNTRENIGLIDFVYWAIRFGNLWVVRLKGYYTGKKKLHYVEYIKKVPEIANPRWKALADDHQGHKLILGRQRQYGDILFLGTLYYNSKALGRLVFQYEQPYLSGTPTAPNTYLYLSGYYGHKFDLSLSNFWNGNFYSDENFWGFISSFKPSFLDAIDISNQKLEDNYYKKKNFRTSYYDAIFANTYLNEGNIKMPSYKDIYGSNREFFDLFVNYENIPRIGRREDGIELFQIPVYPKPAPNIYGLHGFLKKTTGSNQKLTNGIKYGLNQAQGIYQYFYGNKTNLISTLAVDNSKKNLNPPYLYPFKSYVTFSPYPRFQNFDVGKLNKKEFGLLVKYYDEGITGLEEQMGWEPYYFTAKAYDWITWSYFIVIMNRGLIRLEGSDIKFDIDGQLGILAPTQKEVWDLMGGMTPKPSTPQMGEILAKLEAAGKPKHKIFDHITVDQKGEFYTHELRIGALENKFNLGASEFRIPSKIINFQRSSSLNTFDTVNGVLSANSKFDYLPNLYSTVKPWYYKSLVYFGLRDIDITSIAKSGYIRHFTPVPYPAAFSTVGFTWMKHQFLIQNGVTRHIASSPTYVGDGSSRPIISYSNVELFLYLDPFIKIFENFFRILIRIISYPIEWITTFFISGPPLFGSYLPVIIFFNVVWFIYYYIYYFVLFYFLYFFFKYYFYNVGFGWFYERMFESGFLSQYTNYIYWHTLTDLWKEAKTPEQLFLLNMQTLILLQNATMNYLNFFCIKKFKIYSVIDIFIRLSINTSVTKGGPFESSFDLSKFGNLIEGSQITPETDYLMFFNSYYYINNRGFTPLMHEGGSDCSYDTLVWSYFDYLSQFSGYLTRSLWKNVVFKNYNGEIVSILKQFTISISAVALGPQFLFFSMPILDNVLNGKLFCEIINYIEYQSDNKFVELINLIDNKKFNTNNVLSLFSTIIEEKFNIINFSSNSSLTIYTLLESLGDSIQPTKLNTNNYWDTINFWFFAFFGSFGFVPITRYPFLNFDLSHELNGLQITGSAYSNSWIGQSVYSGPFFNTIQHIWWTSVVYSGSFSLSDRDLNVNVSGLNIFNGVGNFSEKGYSFIQSKKIETIFGMVGGFNVFNGGYFHMIDEGKNKPTGIGMRWEALNKEKIEESRKVHFENSMLTNARAYPSDLLGLNTTDGDYDKTNPPLNVCELGITPGFLLHCFGKLPLFSLRHNLTFLNQLNLMFNFKLSNKNGDLYEIFEIFNNNSKNVTVNTILDQTSGFLAHIDECFIYNSSKNDFLSNWGFGFDTSFFLSHFTSWDFYTTTLNKGPTSFRMKKTEIFNSITTLTKLVGFEDIQIPLTSSDIWVNKPFGALDKFELFAFGRFKLLKTLDVFGSSLTQHDPFLSPDGEYSTQNTGLAYYNMTDKRRPNHAYNEFYSGHGKRESFNISLQKNTVHEFLVGWVGELYHTSNHSLSFLYGLQYASRIFDVEALFNKNDQHEVSILFGGVPHEIETFFGTSRLQGRLIIKAFSWLNQFLHPITFGYSYGPKANAGHDFFSWRTKFVVDYTNGFYAYGPYLGFGHTLATSLMPFDATSGFYGTYRQLDDDPWIVDGSTDAMEYFLGSAETQLAGTKLTADEIEEFHEMGERILDSLAYDYGDLYYSFHHPFFLGYFVFWALLLYSKEYYLGLANFSFKRMITGILFQGSKMYGNNSFIREKNFKIFKITGTFEENLYGKYMFGYRTYWINPNKLTTPLASFIDSELTDQTPEFVFDSNSLTLAEKKFFFFKSIADFTRFLQYSLKFNEITLRRALDVKISSLYLLNINWLNLDLPFTLNPYLYIPISGSVFLNFDIKKNYNLFGFGFSHYDSLRESVNLNLFFDWSSGVYLDTLNLTSYSSTFQALSPFPRSFFDHADGFSSSMMAHMDDGSKNIAGEFVSKFTNLMNFQLQDIVFSNGLTMHNLLIIQFFSNTFQQIIFSNIDNTTMHKPWSFLEFYFRRSMLDLGSDIRRAPKTSLGTNEYKIGSNSIPLVLTFKYFNFLNGFYKSYSYDELVLWFSTGLFFETSLALKLFFTSIGTGFFIGYYYIHIFILKYSKFISGLFIKNKNNKKKNDN